jgi:Concanavalin A-like lectin/glucanases superfamily
MWPRLALMLAPLVVTAGCNALFGEDFRFDGGADGGSATTTSSSAGGSSAGGSEPTGTGGHGGEITAWWDEDWSRRRRIDFVAGDDELQDFPVLVILDASDLDLSPFGADAAAMRFVVDDVPLPHEIERVDQNVIVAWVRAPSRESMHLYYDNRSASDGAQPAAVWDNGHRAVYHLAADFRDSARDNHGAALGGFNQPTPVQMGATGAMQFDGANDFLAVNFSAPTIDSTITIEARVQATGLPNSFPHVLGAGDDGRVWQIHLQPGGATYNGRYRLGGVFHTVDAGAVDGWDYVAWRYDGRTVTLLVDGVTAGSAAASGALDPIGLFHIGNNPVLTNRFFEGFIDEVRVSDVARSDTWIAAQQLSFEGALIQLGPEETR